MKTDQEIQSACVAVMSALPTGAIVNRTWLLQQIVLKVSEVDFPDAIRCPDCWNEALAANGGTSQTWLKHDINRMDTVVHSNRYGGIVLGTALEKSQVRPRPYHIEPSPIHGYGLFASRKIHSGERIVSPSASFNTNYKKWHGFNHSCNFNMVLDNWVPIALRDIKRGEEMTVYYGKFPPPNCNCQSKSCHNKK